MARKGQGQLEEARGREMARQMGIGREHAGEEKGEETEETERQEQREHDTRRVHTPTTTHPQSAPPPHVHPQLATAQLGLTPEEANEVHKEGIHAQEELQEEMQ